MTHISEEGYQILKQRLNPSENNYSRNHEADEGPESKLAARIREWCTERNYPHIINPSTKRLSWYIKEGMPDAVIFLPYALIACFELKSTTGRLSDSQKLMKSTFSYLGHNIYKIKSFKAFLEVITAILKRE